MIPQRDKKTDIASDIAQGKFLQKKIKTLSEDCATYSIANGIDLNTVIANVSKREGLNRLQIQRLVEETNTVAYNKRYDKLRGSHDRRITFPIASLDGVIQEMGFSAPPEIANPNLTTGNPGNGELNKAASVQEERIPIHSPHEHLDKQRERYMSKVAAVQEKQSKKERERLERDKNSTIFKIANSLVMSERQYKNGNEVFNTLLSDVPLSSESKDSIAKKASTIADHLVKTNRSHSGFMVTLSENSEEKVADHILGEYSLLKQADDSFKTKEVKVQPTVDVAEFSQLVDLARKLEAQQEVLAKQPAQAGGEVIEP